MTNPNYSWWDVQDENAKLPVKQASPSALTQLFGCDSSNESTAEVATKAAKGAFKSFGKVVSQAVSGNDSGSHDHGPPVSVVAFKLLDLVKMHDDFKPKGGEIPQSNGLPAHDNDAHHHRSYPTPSSSQGRQSQGSSGHHHGSHHQQQDRRKPAASSHQQGHHQHHRQPQQQKPARPAHPAKHQEASLMDFGAPVPTAASSFSSGNMANMTRAEKLKHQYAKQNAKANRVWDPVDERWVEVDHKAGGSMAATSSAPPGAGATKKKKEVGISLDPSNAVGKSANVQAAVNQRVNEMKEAQAKALAEVRAREEQKKVADAEEDVVRKKLTPKIKAWSEEHGKKKQLRALLASLHTILWPGANWKQISIGDVLDDSKVKRQFHKASRVVHPDKTQHLDAEQRFLAKRIFDALSQAKTEFDNGAK